MGPDLDVADGVPRIRNGVFFSTFSFLHLFFLPSIFLEDMEFRDRGFWETKDDY